MTTQTERFKLRQLRLASMRNEEVVKKSYIKMEDFLHLEVLIHEEMQGLNNPKRTCREY